ncbi:MAG: 50S ribosomal protein L4 [Lachnospiraceae bacterium]|jgi:large subunit ribosomal protein L4|nr:50S ribosomal protein L4 [Lachnospiraceae bacterium]
MASVSVYDMKGKEVGTMELSDEVFAAEVNEHLVHMAVVKYLADNRQGTQKAKGRREVSGGGRKPWRQKGTGHARQGSIRAAQWKGGGMIFAPVPRDYSFKMNRKEKRAALKGALTSRLQDGKLIVIDELKLDEIKTSAMAQFMKDLKLEKAMIVTADHDTNVVISARNIPELSTTQVGKLSVYDILNGGTLVLTRDTAEKIGEVYA